MKCTGCGNDNPENAQFCAGCGANLDEASSSVATSNPRPFPAILLIAIRIVLIAIGLGLALLLLQDETFNQTIIPWLGAPFLIAGLFIFPRQANQRGAIKVWLLGGLTGSVTGLLYFLATFFLVGDSFTAAFFLAVFFAVFFVAATINLTPHTYFCSNLQQNGWEFIKFHSECHKKVNFFDSPNSGVFSPFQWKRRHCGCEYFQNSLPPLCTRKLGGARSVW